MQATQLDCAAFEKPDRVRRVSISKRYVSGVGMRVVIIGGTSQLSKALISALLSHDVAFSVCVLSRTADCDDESVRVIRGHYKDLAVSTAFRRELETFDAVVHLADGLPVLQEGKFERDRRFADGLLEGSRRLVHAVRACRVPLFLYVSSIKAIADESDERILVESSAPKSTRLYGLTKLRLEREIAELLARSATRRVIVRSPVVYGPLGCGSLMRLLKLADSPFPLPFSGLANKRSIISAGNLASALASILSVARARDGVYHVHDGQPLSTTQIVELFRKALGRSRRLFPMPSAASTVLQAIPVVGPNCSRLYGSLQISDALFRETFAWHPVEGSQAALADAAVNFVDSGRTGLRGLSDKQSNAGDTPCVGSWTDAMA
jgi:nucleoside-diphosphate-sugar epimerase